MRSLHWIGVGVLLIATAVHAAPIASSTFNTNNDGWLLVTTLGYSASASWMNTGGNPGGFIYGQDPDIGAFGFAAPAKFLGDVSAAYGYALTFDVAAYQMPQGPTSWVGLSGGGYELICPYNAPTSIFPAWHSRSITLLETTGWIDNSTSLPATHAQMIATLSSLDGLAIATEFVEGFGDDISGLDNVMLAPEPTCLILLACGGVLLRKRV